MVARLKPGWWPTQHQEARRIVERQLQFLAVWDAYSQLDVGIQNLRPTEQLQTLGLQPGDTDTSRPSRRKPHVAH